MDELAQALLEFYLELREERLRFEEEFEEMNGSKSAQAVTHKGLNVDFHMQART